MSLAQPEWLSTGSTERPMIFTLRRSNSGLIFAMYPSSVVQTGVKSFGCEKSTAHESPIQSWKRICPWVVSASKSGAVSPSFRAICFLLGTWCFGAAPRRRSRGILDRAERSAKRRWIHAGEFREAGGLGLPPLGGLLGDRHRDVEVAAAHADRDERHGRWSCAENAVADVDDVRVGPGHACV